MEVEVKKTRNRKIYATAEYQKERRAKLKEIGFKEKKYKSKKNDPDFGQRKARERDEQVSKRFALIYYGHCQKYNSMHEYYHWEAKRRGIIN